MFSNKIKSSWHFRSKRKLKCEIRTQETQHAYAYSACSAYSADARTAYEATQYSVTTPTLTVCEVKDPTNHQAAKILLEKLTVAQTFKNLLSIPNVQNRVYKN